MNLKDYDYAIREAKPQSILIRKTMLLAELASQDRAAANCRGFEPEDMSTAQLFSEK